MPIQPSIDLALGLLLVGITLFAVILYLRLQSNRLRDYLLKLYLINRQVNQDVLDFVDQAWPILEAAGFKSLQGEIQWFGERKAIQHGESGTESYPISIAEWGISIRLNLTSGRIRGENLLLANLVLQNFKVLLELDVSGKTSEFLLSQKRLEKYQLFVQHDIKNIAQFIVLLSEQVKGSKTDVQKVALVDHLQTMMPTVTERADKTIKQMTQPNKPLQDIEAFSFAEEVHKLAKGLELNYHLQGDVRCELSRTLFDQVVKSVLENFKDHGCYEKQVHIEISEACEVRFYIEEKGFELNVPVERLFEPFWSTSDSGMGLGLFIARELLSTIGGSIQLDYSDERFGFIVQF